MNERVGQTGDANVLRVMWSIQKMVHKLGHVLTMDVRKIGNQAVDNTNEERADIRSNSDRISQMQVGLSGSINDIRYNISNLISSQKQLGKSVSVALENMMQILNQMVGMITRRDEQIEELGKLKAFGIDLANPESILEFLRKSAKYRTKSNSKTNVEPNHILLPKSSSNVSSEVKIIRSKQPAKLVTIEKHAECNNTHVCNTTSPTGNVTSTTETPLNENKTSNKTMSEDYKENNVSSKTNVSLKNGNTTVEHFDIKHGAMMAQHKGHKGAKVSHAGHGNGMSLNHHKHVTENLKHGTSGNKYKNHGANVGISKHDKMSGTNNPHGNKLVEKHGLRRKHRKHKFQDNAGGKVHTNHIKTHSNNVKINGKKKHSNKKHKVMGKHKKKHNKTLVTKEFNNVEHTNSTKTSAESPKNQTTSYNATTLPVSKSKLLKNETIPGAVTQMPVSVTQNSQNQTKSLGTTIKLASTKLPSNGTGSHNMQGNKSLLFNVVTKSPPGNVTINTKSLTEPSKIQVTSRNTIQNNNTNTLTSHTEAKSGNSSTLAKLLTNPKSALNISTTVQTTPVPTAKTLVNETEKGKTSVNCGGDENRQSFKQADIPKSGGQKVALNKQEQSKDESKNASKTDNIISGKENHPHKTKSTKLLHQNQSKKSHGMPHRNSNNKKPHGHKHGGKHAGRFNESKKNQKHRKSHSGDKQNLESNKTNLVKNSNAGISKFHNSHSILNKFKNIKHTAATNENIKKPVSAKKGHNINNRIQNKKRQHSPKGLTAKTGHNIHKGLHGKNGHSIHKEINRTKKQNVHKGMIGNKGQVNHRGIPGMKGSNSHNELITKTGQNIHKGKAASKRKNAHKRITTKKGHNIHKGIIAKHGQEMYRGMADKKGQHIHKVTKDKVHHGKTHHGKKQVHRHAKSLDNILSGLFREKQRYY